MQLRNHIAYRFLTDDHLAHELMEHAYYSEYHRMGDDKGNEEDEGKIRSLYEVISFHHQKAYYITNTVIDKLELLKVSRKDGLYDYTIFNNVADSKLTFIFKNNSLLRMHICDDMISFCYLKYDYYTAEEKLLHKVPGSILSVYFYVNRITGERCDHFAHKDVQGIEKMVYHLLCFFFLSENTEQVVAAGKSYGTKKQQDALSNDTNVPVTIVNSCWNVTSIRLEGFNVSGHFRLQPYPSLNCTKMIFIEPYGKLGYVRKATNLELV